MRIFTLAAMAAVLVSCASPDVRGVGEAGLSQQDIDLKDETTCKSFGAAPGTSLYLDCRLRLRSTRSAEDGGRRMRATIAAQ